MKRADIVADIIDYLGEITTANGYTSDFTGSVFSWKSEQVPAGAKLWVEVHDPQMDFKETLISPGAMIQLSVNVAVFCADGGSTAGTIRQAIQDIYSCLVWKRDDFVTGHKAKIIYQGDEMEIFEEDIIAGVGLVKLMIEYPDFIAKVTPPEVP